MVSSIANYLYTISKLNCVQTHYFNLFRNYVYIHLTVCKQMTDFKLNYQYYIAIYETIYLCANK